MSVNAVNNTSYASAATKTTAAKGSEKEVSKETKDSYIRKYNTNIHLK